MLLSSSTFISRSLMIGVGLSLLGAGCNPLSRMQDNVIERAVENSIEQKVKAESGQDVDVDIGNGTVSVTGQDGQSTFTAGENIDIPADFPKAVMVYPKAVAKSAITIPGEDGASLVLESGDQAIEVRDWYKSEAASKGWTQEASLELEAGSYMMAFRRTETGDPYRMTVSISTNKDTGKVAIVIGYGK